MKIAVVGATGMVGSIMLQVLGERGFPFLELIPVATEKSVGGQVKCCDKDYVIIGMAEAVSKNPDIALFSAGGGTSLEWAPKFADQGTIVIDNSSAWRMDPNKKLIVPEINGALLEPTDRIIANPNCSTIQMVVALSPLHERYKIKRIVVSTYQSVTGTGVKALKQLEEETKGGCADMVYKYPIHRNVIPQCDVFLDNGYTKEEMKLVHETRKILGDERIHITATAVRVPVKGGHSESVNVEFEKPFDLNDVKNLIKETAGVVLIDDPENYSYPMPLYAEGKDDVFVGRVRRDESVENGLNLWIVADNLRKGAATNAIQIAELLVSKGLVKTKPLR